MRCLAIVISGMCGVRNAILPVAQNFGILSATNTLLQKNDYRFGPAQSDDEFCGGREGGQLYQGGGAARSLEVGGEPACVGTRKSAWRSTAVSLDASPEPDRSRRALSAALPRPRACRRTGSRVRDD